MLEKFKGAQGIQRAAASLTRAAASGAAPAALGLENTGRRAADDSSEVPAPVRKTLSENGLYVDDEQIAWSWSPVTRKADDGSLYQHAEYLSGSTEGVLRTVATRPLASTGDGRHRPAGPWHLRVTAWRFGDATLTIRQDQSLPPGGQQRQAPSDKPWMEPAAPQQQQQPSPLNVLPTAVQDTVCDWAPTHTFFQDAMLREFVGDGTTARDAVLVAYMSEGNCAVVLAERHAHAKGLTDPSDPLLHTVMADGNWRSKVLLGVAAFVETVEFDTDYDEQKELSSGSKGVLSGALKALTGGR